MQTLIADRNFNPPFHEGYELTADSSNSSDFSHPMSAVSCQGFGRSAQCPTYEPRRYATLPTPSIGADLRPSRKGAGKAGSDRFPVEKGDKHASHSSDGRTQRKGTLLWTDCYEEPHLLEEYRWENVWNPRASMAFDSAKGLLNPLGQNNCFLNSAVQVLWHLDVFRRNFRILSGHGCVQNSCIFCALKVIFTQFQFSDHQVLPSDVLREALAEAFANEQRFQMGRMDDASECFETILQRIHFHLAWNQSEDTCQVLYCIPHQKFSMLLVEQVVCACNASDEPLIFNQLVYHVSTSAIISYLRLARLRASSEQNLSFGHLLYRARNSGETRRCPSGCGRVIETRHTLANTPEVISIGFIWDSDHPTRSHVRKVVQCISTELRPSELVYSIVDEGWGQTTTLRLVGLVCYHGRHYSTFVFHSKMLTWILFDDARVREIGPAWETLMDLFVAGLYQPLLLLYADPNDRLIDVSTAPARNFPLQRELCSMLEETEHGRIPEVALSQKQAGASCCSPGRDLLFGGDCTPAETGSTVCMCLSPDCQHSAQSVEIQETPLGWIQGPETTTRDKSRVHLMDNTKRKNGDFLMLNHVTDMPQERMFSEQAIATKEKAAGNFSTTTAESSFYLNRDQVGAGRCASVANGTHGNTVSDNLQPITNRAKTVQFSQQGVGVSPGGTVESFVISDSEQFPRFQKQFAKKSNLLCSANRVSSSLHGIERRPSGDEDCVGDDDGSLDAQNNSRTAETLRESDHGPNPSTAHSTDDGKPSGVYINEKTVRDVLSSQGISRGRLTPGGMGNCGSAQIIRQMAEVIRDKDNASRNRKSTETKVKSVPNITVRKFPVSRGQTLRKESNTDSGSLDKAKFSGNTYPDRQQLLLRTSKPAICNKPDATSQFPARTSKLLANTESSSAAINSVSTAATTAASTSAYSASKPASTETSVSDVPHSAAASCQSSVNNIPSLSVEASQGYYTFPRRNQNIESQASNSSSFARPINSSQSSCSKNRNYTHEQISNDQRSADDNNGNACQSVDQRSESNSSDDTPKCQAALSTSLDVQVAEQQPSGGGSSGDSRFQDSCGMSKETRMQLFRDSLQLLKSCDEHVTLSKSELDVGNERLAAEHCRMASELLEDAFRPCQLDSDLEFLFCSSQNNVQKCQSNLKRYLARFSNDDEANEECPEQIGSGRHMEPAFSERDMEPVLGRDMEPALGRDMEPVLGRDMEPVFYLSAYVPSWQVESNNTKGRSVNNGKISSFYTCSQVSAYEDKDGISKSQLKPMVNLTQDPVVSRKIADASQIKTNAHSTFSGVNNTNIDEPNCVSRNGKFVNSLHDYRSSSSSSSLPRKRTNLSSLYTTSVPRNGTSPLISSVSLPINSTSVSSSFSTSLPRNSTTVSSSMSLPKSSTTVFSSMSLPRNGTSISSSMSLPRKSTSIFPTNSTKVSSSSSVSLPRHSTSVSSMSLNGTSSSSLSIKGTSASLCARNTALPGSGHRELPKSRISYPAGDAGNSVKACRTSAEPRGLSSSNDHGPCSTRGQILDPTCGRTPGECCTAVLSSASVPSLVKLTLECDARTIPGARGRGLSPLDSAVEEPSSLLLMSQRLQKLEKQNRAIRDRLLKETDVLWS